MSSPVNEPANQYAPGYGKNLVESFSQRTGAVEASFVLPHLQSNWRVLDCGCGPGSITVDLARKLSDGQVVAIDIASSQVELARRRAADHGASNVEYQVANVYALPFTDSSFDAVFAHAVFQHLDKPAVALSELHRVLKPGGLIALRDDDPGSLLIYPPSTELRELLALLTDDVGATQPRAIGRSYRRHLRLAGFADIRMSASCEYDGTRQATQRRARIAVELVRRQADRLVAEGRATAGRIDTLVAAVSAWGDDDDAFDAITWCEVIAQKPKDVA